MASTVPTRTSTSNPASRATLRVVPSKTAAPKPEDDPREVGVAWLRDVRGILEQIARDARRFHAATKHKGHPLFGLFNRHELTEAATLIEEASLALHNADFAPPCPIALPDPVPGFDIDE